MLNVIFLAFGCLITSKISLAGANLLQGKTWAVSDYPDYAKNMADGDIDSCMWLRANNVMFAVFDLGKVHRIDKVLMYNRRFRSSTPFSMYIGEEFKACHFRNQIADFRLCKSGILQNDQQIEIPCEHSLNEGRYLAFVKGSFESKEISEEFNFCEVELKGEALFDWPGMERPVMKDQTMKPISREDFPLVDILRKNAPAVTVSGYSKGFHRLNNLCQPIIWDSKYNLTLALACETDDKKGRAAFFGKQYYFYYLKDEPVHKEMQNNFLKWLSPNRNLGINDLIDSKNLKSESDVAALKDGDIVDYNNEIAVSDEVFHAIVKDLKAGRIAVMMDTNPQDRDNAARRPTVVRILDVFNIGFDNTYFTYGSTETYTVNDSDFSEELFDLQDRLIRYLPDTAALLRNAESILATYDKLPKKLLEKKDLKELYLKYTKRYHDLLNYICPCKEDPATDKTDRALILLLSRLYESQSLAHSDYKLPCLDIFPGNFKKSPETGAVTLEIYGEIEATRNPTGYFLEAGKTFNYEVVSAEGDWFVSIGCHSDLLPEKRSGWSRYPDLYIDRVGLTEKGSIYSPYGGAIWIVNGNKNSKLQIKLTNVIATPFFNIHDENAISDWDTKQRNNPGLWAQIAGEDLVICEQTKLVKGFSGEYLMRLMRSWDKMVRGLYVLTGDDWRVHRPEQTELDIQTSFGYGHSGYPVVAWDDWFVNIFNETYIATLGSWGMCHELGHNRQSSQYTWSAVTEATNNVFCILSFPKIWSLPQYGITMADLKNDVKDIKKFFANGATYSDFVDSTTVELAMYAHLANSFGLGFYHEVFSYYFKHPEVAPKSDEDIIDMWVKVGSDVTGMNLAPIHEFWGVSVGDGMKKQLSSLPCFFPEDYLTEMGANKAKEILGKYPDCLRKSKYFKDFDIEPLVQGHRPNFIKKIHG